MEMRAILQIVENTQKRGPKISPSKLEIGTRYHLSWGDNNEDLTFIGLYMRRDDKVQPYPPGAFPPALQKGMLGTRWAFQDDSGKIIFFYKHDSPKGAVLAWSLEGHQFGRNNDPVTIRSIVT